MTNPTRESVIDALATMQAETIRAQLRATVEAEATREAKEETGRASVAPGIGVRSPIGFTNEAEKVTALAAQMRKHTNAPRTKPKD